MTQPVRVDTAARPIKVDGNPSRFALRGRAPVLAWVGLAAIAVVVRFWSLTGQPFDFQSTRQLYDVLLARGLWMDLGGTPPQGTREAMLAARTAVIEPPIVQWVAALVYTVVGHESVAVVRALLALCWVAGAMPVARTLRLVGMGRAGVVAGVVVWLFQPFAVLASRSFQPDGVMTVCIAWAVLAIVRADRRRDARSIHLAALASAVAVFVKITAAFLVIPVFLVLAWRREGTRGLTSAGSCRHLILTAAPTAGYLVWGAWQGFLAGQDSGRVLPRLLLDPAFWARWWVMASSVIGFSGLLVLAVALVLAKGTLRDLLAGLLVGYLALGMTFTYHITTHNYYHLPLLLPLCYGVGVLVDKLAAGASRLGRPLAWAVLALLMVQVGDTAVTPAVPHVMAGPSRQWTQTVKQAQEAGVALQHSTGVVFLTEDYGHPYEVYGYLAGVAWPYTADLKKDALDGKAGIAPAARLEQLRSERPLTWFLVTDRAEVDQQPGLADLLGSFQVGAHGDGWVAYRLS